MTATQLLANAMGQKSRLGTHRCFYCGGKCDDSYLSRDLVKDSFTARDTVAGGEHVCWGCVAAMNESGDVCLLNGETRTGQKFRCYTWIITHDSAVAATKSHLAQLRSLCLSPPKPPFVICLSDSGQRHLLYRAAVCHDQQSLIVTLEGERVCYSPADLESRLSLCRKIVAAIGKPALAGPLTFRSAMNIIAHHDDESLVNQWNAVQNEPLSRLAAWISPAKEECLNEFPGRIAAPALKVKHGRVSATPMLFD